jgi:hypothetical protein
MVAVAEQDPNGEAWDEAGGMPDPFLCAWKNSEQPSNEVCSTAVNDVLTANFNEHFDAAIYQDDTWYFSVWDEDTPDNTFVGGCSGPIEVRIIQSEGISCDGQHYSNLTIYLDLLQ